jgi:exodeoxyribonuclease VII small subunit
MTEQSPAETKPTTYESAVARLEVIIARLDSGEAELRETLALCGEAKELIQFCKAELDAVSGELKELKLEELVSDLEARPEEPNSA